MASSQWRVTAYAATIFISSALLMVLEIVAARLIAPYVGVSLYTWTSIIGVILAGLSLGNWLGGIWADRGATSLAAGVTLALAALASMAILLLLTWVAPFIMANGFNVLSATFLYVVLLFFIPAMLLGVVTPLLTTLALRIDSRTGHIVGRMHALAALGSIAGTFLSGYWLIQYFGTRSVLIGCSVLLLLLSLPFLRRRRVIHIPVILAAFMVLVGLTHARDGYLNPCDVESSYYCIRVVDASDEAPSGTARAMILDHLLHSINHYNFPELLLSPYVHLMDELVSYHFAERTPGLRYFFAGGGAYTQPRAVRSAWPDAKVVVAELDPAVTGVAAQKMWVNTQGMQVMHQDARMALGQMQNQAFDVIVGDVFHDVAVPYHLTTREYAQLVHSRLVKDGMYLMNVVDRYPDPALVKSMYKTLGTVFANVNIWLEKNPHQSHRATYVLAASDRPQVEQELHSRQGLTRTWVNVTGEILGQGTSLGELPVLTDDFVPVERLVSNILFEDIN